MSKSFQLATCYRFVCPTNAPLIARLDKFRFELSELFSITDTAGRILLRDADNLCGGDYQHARHDATSRSLYARVRTRVYGSRREAVDWNYLAVIYGTRGPLSAKTVASILSFIFFFTNTAINPLCRQRGKKWRVAWRINGPATDKAYRFANYAVDLLSRRLLGRKIINPISVRRKLVATSNRIDFHDILDEARDRPTIGDVFMGIPRVQ